MTDSGERGSVAVLVALMMVVFAGFAALGVDVARVYVEQQHLRQAASAAALAGAAALPAEPATAQQTATQYAANNGVPGSELATQVTTGDTTLDVTASAPFHWSFGQVLGLAPFTLHAQAAARVGVLQAVQGTVPWGVPSQAFAVGRSYTLFGQLVSPGNFGGLALGGTGAANYEQNIEHGYGPWLAVGDQVTTEPGKMAGPTSKAVSYRISADPNASWDHVAPGSPRLLRVPVIGSYGNGRSSVQVVALAVFFLQGMESGDVIGIFEDAFVPGQWCAIGSGGCQNDGAYVIKLVE